MTRTIFTDIDGVLNNRATLSRIHQKYRGQNQKFPHMREYLEPSLIRRLYDLVYETNSSIVISSSWRERFDLDEFREMFAYAGFMDPSRIVAIGKRGCSKEDAIKNYLHITGDTLGFVVIDDSFFEDADARIRKRWVKPCGSVGLTVDNVAQARRILTESCK